MSIINVGKLEAAEQQLDKAIELWFDDDDPIPIHTLACSAYQIIHDINSRMGSRDLIYDSLVIKDEFRNEVINNLKKAYNFFKHADRDWSDTIEFETENTGFFILYSCLGLESLGVNHTIIRRIFCHYYIIMHPEIATDKYKNDLNEILNKNHSNEIYEIPKLDFFNYYKAKLNG